MRTQFRQRGVAALAVSMILLFGMTLVVFFVNRSMLFEQRTSANQYRSTRAFEAAEAGIEWATGMLNTKKVTINTSCTLGAGTTSFRDTYAPATLPAGASVYTFNPVNTVHPSCSMSGGALTCSCPAAGSVATSSTDPGFVLTFNDTSASDPETIEIVSRGCTNASQCSASATTAADGMAMVRVLLKVRPNVRAVPAAALTTGGWANICGSFNITNADKPSNGNLVNSGSQITIGNTYTEGTLHAGESSPPACGGGPAQTLDTLDGTPIQQTLVAKDDSLWSMSSSSDAMFETYFGMTLAQFKEQNSQCTVTGNTGTTNATTLLSYYNSSTLKCRTFFVDGPLQFSGGGTLGGTNDPIVIVSSSSMQFNGNYDIYGLIYSDSADWNADGSGRANVYGAVVSRSNYKNNGNGTITYDANLLKKVREQGGLFIRIPGSWRDY